MPNLIQTVMGAFSPDVTGRIAGSLGEPPSAVSSGLQAAGPALLAAGMQRSQSPDGASSLLGLVRQATSGGNPLDDMGTIAADENARASFLSHGQGLASSLLGGNANAATSAVASHAGVGMGTASKLLGIAAPVVLGALAKAVGPSPTASGLQSLLNNERGGIMNALPSGLGSLFGGGARAAGATAGRGATSADAYATNAVYGGAGTAGTGAARAERPGIGRFLPWIVLALVAIGLLLTLRNCAAARRPAATSPGVAEQTTTPQPQTTTTPGVAAQGDQAASTAAQGGGGPATTTQGAAAPANGAPSATIVTLKLPDGQSVQVQQGSIGFNLANFLRSNEPGPRTFTFDNLNYDTASPQLTSASQPTLTAMSDILKAYPNANVRVVGYTDSQGNPTLNKNLSEQRAASVKERLVQNGVAGNRIQTAGMGAANPIADNSTAAGRAKNRRTELVVLTK